MSYNDLTKSLQSLANPTQAALLRSFFKTGKGQYGEGDQFLGIKVPVLRSLVKPHQDLSASDLRRLLHSPIHEYRFVALMIWVYRFEHTQDPAQQGDIFQNYLANTRWINNWDLVDCSAPNIVGGYLLSRDRKILYSLAKSDNLWERRIAILATFAFIRQGESADTFAIADILLQDSHDLIHKAVGWMLREVGKRISEPAEQAFLLPRAASMPRTMLRYAIERFSPQDRQRFMGKG
jgi:3-methyladenine DNA glycosylase AlkD